MKQSNLYTKTRKEVPKDEVSKNAKLLIQAGFIHKEMAGVYAYLPLGLRVLRKIEEIIREEMNAIGGQEVILTSLQNPAIWKENDRWDDNKIDIWFKSRDEKFGFAWSHEEAMINMAKNHISSYKDLPVYTYQFQTKFRNESRAKSGILRGREFLMKDLYSFNKNEKGLDDFYAKCIEAYKKVFEKVGLGEITYLTYASGGAFTEYSHEFQTLDGSGEDTIFVDKKKKLAINKEVYTDETIKDAGLDKNDLEEVKSIETGNIFKFGTKYTDNMGLKYKDENGKEESLYLGSYGIGVTRLMGTIVEVLSDEDGMIWPESIAPFTVHLIELEKGLGKEVYKKLKKDNIDVLYDDRVDASAGEKFNDADLIGIPWRLVVSKKTEGKIECKRRGDTHEEILDYEELIPKFL